MGVQAILQNRAAKILAVCMTLIFSAAILCGCSENAEAPSSNSDAQPSAQEQQSEAEADAGSESGKTEQTVPSAGFSIDPSLGNLVLDEPNEKQYRVMASDSTITFSGAFSGAGRTVVKLMNPDQTLYKHVASVSEGGIIRATVDAVPGQIYLVEVECNNGRVVLEWTGTAAA